MNFMMMAATAVIVALIAFHQGRKSMRRSNLAAGSRGVVVDHELQ